MHITVSATAKTDEFLLRFQFLANAVLHVLTAGKLLSSTHFLIVAIFQRHTGLT